jgi:hypothetical protein
MRSRAAQHSQALASVDGATYAVGVSLGTSLAGAVILLVWTGTPWPLLAVLVLGTALAWWFARPAAGRDRDTDSSVPARRTTAFTDWNSEALLGGFDDVAPTALAAATSAAGSTFVDEQA